MISVGPIPRIEPGESVYYTVAYVAAKQIPDGTGSSDTKYARNELEDHLGWSRRTFLGEDLNENGELDPGEDLNKNLIPDRYILPEPPAVPKVKVVVESGHATLFWDKASLVSIDPISKEKDFEGFNVYATRIGDDKDFSLSEDLRLIATFDSVGNEIGVNNGFSAIFLKEPAYFEGDTVAYYFRYDVPGLSNGWQYLIAVTAFDKGDETINLEGLESSKNQNAVRVFSGTLPRPTDGTIEIGVYPNPYRTTAAWNGPSSTTQKIYFYNLPELCLITIYTISGDVVAELTHDAETYSGQDIRWFRDFAGQNVEFSGGEHAWDILSSGSQQVAQGLYLFTVQDLKTGNVYDGTFTILK